MANETTLVFETSLPIPFICANGTGIEQGEVLKLADPFTVSKVAAIRDVVGGIAAAEKIANDGVLTVPVFRSGIFKGTASGNIGAGDPIINSDDTNVFQSAVGTTAVLLSGNRIFGVSFETATNAQTFLFELRPSFITV